MNSRIEKASRRKLQAYQVVGDWEKIVGDVIGRNTDIVENREWDTVREDKKWCVAQRADFYEACNIEKDKRELSRFGS